MPADHGDALYAASRQPDADRSWDYVGAGPFADRRAFDAWLEAYLPIDDPLLFAIVDKTTGLAAGVASYLDIKPDHGGIEIGHIWLSPALQRTPVATEALFLMMARAMDDLGYLRLQWKCNALNRASRRAALRLGFRFEGEHFAHILVKGRVRDTAFFSILAEEWPEVATRIRSWLNDANFDADGRQITALSRMMGVTEA